MKHFGLLGHNLTHTMSPHIHNLLLEKSGVTGDYKVFDIPPDELENHIPNLLSLDGFNVTIPYKTDIIKYLDQLDPSAERIGAVNVVIWKDGKSIGYNTDCLGFTNSLARANMPIAGSVAIIGIGGVGRMFAIECARAGCDVTLLLKDSQLERGEILRDELKKYSSNTYIENINSISKKYDLLINATPVGMYPNINSCPISSEDVCNFSNIFDCIYNPKQTQLIKYGLSLGIPCLDGLPMLVYQAMVAHKIWNNTAFSEHVINLIIDTVSDILEEK